jgi:hypothetical protein
MSTMTRRSIFWGGIGLGVGGVILMAWGFRRLPHLANYQRLALLLPLMYAIPLMHVDTFATWSDAPSYARMNAGASLFFAAVLTAGCLFWLISDPEAKAQ